MSTRTRTRTISKARSNAFCGLESGYRGGEVLLSKWGPKQSQGAVILMNENELFVFLFFSVTFLVFLKPIFWFFFCFFGQNILVEML